VITWIVFDAMGVIYPVSDDVSGLLLPFVQLHVPFLNKRKFITTYIQASVGSISCKTFWETIGLGDKYPAIEKEYLDTMLTLDSGFTSAANELHQNYKLGLLSNDVGDWSRYLRKRFNIDFFDTAVVSGDELCKKPDKKIFELFLERSKAKAEECVFIDDRKVNLEVAHMLGLKTIWFHRIDDAHGFEADREIKSFGSLIASVQEISEER
jgi:putative hydrolase of the HAD superfamily